MNNQALILVPLFGENERSSVFDNLANSRPDHVSNRGLSMLTIFRLFAIFL